jgi:hypothetical protein
MKTLAKRHGLIETNTKVRSGHSKNFCVRNDPQANAAHSKDRRKTVCCVPFLLVFRFFNAGFTHTKSAGNRRAGQ